MGWNKIVGEVAKRLPDFNDELLVGYKKRNINSCPDYLREVFVAVTDHINMSVHGIHVDYVGYEVLGPAEQVMYTSEHARTKKQYNINESCTRLVKYDFRVTSVNDAGATVVEDQSVRLYLPYWVNNGVTINGRQYYFKHVMSDIIVRDSDHVIIKVMRSPIQCWRDTVVQLKDINGKEYPTAIVSIHAYHRGKDTSQKARHPPLVLYFLAEFGFDEALRRFDVLGKVELVSEPSDDPDSVMFEIIKDSLYLRVDRCLLDDLYEARVVASIWWILTSYKEDTIQYYSQIKDPVLYKSILGKIVYGRSTTCGLAVSHAEKHLESLRTYLDVRTKKELDPDGRLMLHDIYDVLLYMFGSIDMWLVNYSPNDLFEKRLEGINKTLYFLSCSIWSRVYQKTNKKLNASMLCKSVQVDPMSIKDIHSAECADTPKQYNDNQFLTILVDKLRQSKPSDDAKQTKSSNKNNIQAPEHKFHPSFVAIESVLSIPKSNPGIAGDINPFVRITPDGRFDKEATTWYKEIEPIKKYL